jgi:enoyl-CoA hydratase/carnithine racemase
VSAGSSIPELGDDPLVVTREGRVATLWLNRPAKRNAVTYEMWQGIARTCDELAADPSVRVLVVRGVGGHFCAGADIGDVAERGGEVYFVTQAADRALAAFPKPTIAFIEGSCVGGGAEIALSLDLRIAEAGARFGITPARLGIAYPPFAVERAVQALGPSATKHLLFSAELVDSARALQIGLVDEVHDGLEAAEERLAAFTTLLAEQRSGLTQQAAKAMVDEVVLTGGVSAETSERWSAEVAAGPDRPEGVAAFFEKRAPRFTWAD